MDFAHIVEEFDTVCSAMKPDQLLRAIDHLYSALHLLIFVHNEVVDSSISSLDLTEKLAEAWFEVNKCRLYTEKIVDLEELLIPAMGSINDAKSMLESLIHWKLGLTLHGKYNILQCIRDAAGDGIGPALDRLESCLSRGISNGQEHSEYLI